MALEEYYASSQDIEFGIADGKLSILQTRPITTRVSNEQAFSFVEESRGRGKSIAGTAATD